MGVTFFLNLPLGLEYILGPFISIDCVSKVECYSQWRLVFCAAMDRTNYHTNGTIYMTGVENCLKIVTVFLNSSHCIELSGLFMHMYIRMNCWFKPFNMRACICSSKLERFSN